MTNPQKNERVSTTSFKSHELAHVAKQAYLAGHKDCPKAKIVKRNDGTFELAIFKTLGSKTVVQEENNTVNQTKQSVHGVKSKERKISPVRRAQQKKLGK